MQTHTNLTQADSHQYRIAGMEIVSNRMASLPIEGYADLQVSVQFIDLNTHGSRDHVNSDWIEVPGLIAPEIRLHRSGKQAAVLQDSLDQESCAVAIRRLVPFASALQGGIMLHASSVAINNRLVCFIAESGSGKSTLAGALRSIGYSLISDDLLPCRTHQSEIMIPHTIGKRLTHIEISVICFLSRDATLNSPELRVITQKKCLELLMFNGFGEMKDKTIWQRQFETYGRIAAKVRACLLTIPDDMSLLKKTARELGSQFETMTGTNH